MCKIISELKSGTTRQRRTKYVWSLPSGRPLSPKLARTREGGGLGRSNLNWYNGSMVYMSPPNFIKIGRVVKKCGPKYGSESKKQRGGGDFICAFSVYLG